MNKLTTASQSRPNILSRGAKRIQKVLRILVKKIKFTNSIDHWNENYNKGGTSGGGSYGRLAEFKAETLNNFVAEKKILSVVELGCGDGNQLSFSKYKKYISFDVSISAINLCREKFREDSTKQFIHYTPSEFSFSEDSHSDLALSLDVIFHLVEDEVFDRYMWGLFSLGGCYVVIYSSNTNSNPIMHAPHIRHRKFTDWVDANLDGWILEQKIENRFPFGGDSRVGSRSEFYIYRKNKV